MDKIEYLTIGNGIAGLSAAKEIRNKDSNGSILMISKENYSTYYRMRLTEALGNNMKSDDLVINDFKWYDDRNIKLLLGKTVICNSRGKQSNIRKSWWNPKGKIVANNIIGGSSEYYQPKPFSTVRVGDIKLFTAGNILDYDKIYEYRDENKDSIHKIFVKHNKLVGSILFGDIMNMSLIKEAVFSDADIDTFLEDNQSFNKLRGI